MNKPKTYSPEVRESSSESPMMASATVLTSTHATWMNTLSGQRPGGDFALLRSGTMRLIHLCLVVLTLAACSAASRPASLEPGSVAITHAVIVDVEGGRLLPDHTVLIVGERIAAVGPTDSVRVPQAARVVDAAGMYVIPGLWDMHVHLGSTGHSTLPLYLANGITGVRDMGGHFAQVKAWRDSVRAGMLLGPRILQAGPIIEGAVWLEEVRREARLRGDATPEGLLSERIGVATPEDARAAVDSAVTLGADFLKLRTNPPPAALAELLRTAQERGLPIAGHVPLPITPRGLANLEFASLEHGYVGVRNGQITSALEGASDSVRMAVFGALAARGVAYTPTLITHSASRLTPDRVIRAVVQDTTGRLDPRRPFVDPILAERWLRDLDMRSGESPIDWAGLYRSWAGDVRVAQAAGVLLLAGSDPGAPMVFPGFSLHDELVALVRDGGLAPIDALRSATLNAARFMGATDSLGVIKRGGAADLVLLEANPLEDIGNTRRIRAVVVRGRYLDRTALNGLLSEAQRNANSQR